MAAALSATEAVAGTVSQPDDDPPRVGESRLRQLVSYGRQVYGLKRCLEDVVDGRRTPQVVASSVATAVFFAGLLRIRSFNALEPRLREKGYRRLVGAKADGRLGSVDTLSRSLRVMDVESAQTLSVEMLRKAERNKVFREGWYGALRYFAIDGWEPFCSRHRHCKECLTRQVRVKGEDGNKTTVEEYYHSGKIRCVRARLTKLDQPSRQPSTWCMLVTGAPQRRLSAERVLAIARARWHIENTGFHQWTSLWRFGHVFTHNANAIRVLFWLFFAAFNLLTLFLYCQLRSYGRDRGKDVNRTISRLVDEMHDDLARLAIDTS